MYDDSFSDGARSAGIHSSISTDLGARHFAIFNFTSKSECFISFLHHYNLLYPLSRLLIINNLVQSSQIREFARIYDPSKSAILRPAEDTENSTVPGGHHIKKKRSDILGRVKACREFVPIYFLCQNIPFHQFLKSKISIYFKVFPIQTS